MHQVWITLKFLYLLKSYKVNVSLEQSKRLLWAENVISKNKAMYKNHYRIILFKFHYDIIFLRFWELLYVEHENKSFSNHYNKIFEISAIGRLCEKCDGKCVICDSYVRPCTLVRICDECNYGSYQGRCVICGGPGVSDAYYCKECTIQEKDVSIFLKK